MGSAHDDQAREHEGDPENEAPHGPPDDLWRILQGIVELGVLYFSYKQNEGAAQIAQALALVIQLSRRQR
jgi:hypothetical protein